MSELDRLLTDLRSSDWRTACRAAEALASQEDARVLPALVDALDAHNTAITEAAMRTLLLRDDRGSIESVWTALTELDIDAGTQAWDVITDSDLPPSALGEELQRRDAASE